MDIFEYLPQLIVAYDGNDEFANLIHVKKADSEKNYLCPCCGGIVKPRALNSTKEQSHYYHKTGKCTKESQLHFFCKNWLFEEGRKFYIEDNLFEVDSIEIEKRWNTQFGNYIPDITVYTTSEKIIYFEMFFSNRKTGDDYFCKWEVLGNDVVEVNIKEYMYKTDTNVIPRFSYLYHDGICYSKPYVKRDLYANTIAKIKHELTRQKVLDYKSRIEKLDWFWQKIIHNENKEQILDSISSMTYEDMVSCYSIVKRKQCVSYLKNDVLELINQKVISEVRKTLDLSYDENVYFDLKHIHGRTYEAGIRLNLKTDHIIYNDIYIHCRCRNFIKATEYPKIVFNKSIFNIDEISIPKNKISELKRIFNETVEYKHEILNYENDITEFEGNAHKIKINNNRYTVLSKIHDDNFEILLNNFYIEELSVDRLSKEIQNAFTNIRYKEFLEEIKTKDEFVSMMKEIKMYNLYTIDIGLNCYSNELYFKLYFDKYCIYDDTLNPDNDDLLQKMCKVKDIIKSSEEKYSLVNKLVTRINNCKNGLWKAEFKIDHYNNCPLIWIWEKIINTSYYPNRHICKDVTLYNFESLSEKDIISKLEKGMNSILDSMEKYYGYRVMEVE